MPDEPKFDPNVPNWWHREPEYEFPELIPRKGKMPTEQEFIEDLAEQLRANTAMLPRTAVERYVTVKDDPVKLRQFLDLVLDMSYDGNLYSHLPKGEEAESKLPRPTMRRRRKSKKFECGAIKRQQVTLSHCSNWSNTRRPLRS